MHADPAAAEVLEFWFGTTAGDAAELAFGEKRWFAGGPGFDAEVRERFGELVERALAGELDAWTGSAPSWLALLLLLDQFTRNLNRRSARAFSGDDYALRILFDGMRRGLDRELPPVRRIFAYMPLQHAENRSLQTISVALVEATAREVPESLRQKFQVFADFARRHRDVVERFGRFPHRNAVLGRETTPEERAHLAAHPHGF